MDGLMSEELAKARAAYELAIVERDKAVNEAIEQAEALVRKVCDETQATVDLAQQKLLTMKRISEITVN